MLIDIWILTDGGYVTVPTKIRTAKDCRGLKDFYNFSRRPDY